MKTRATALTKITFPQINCNVKEKQWRLLEKERAMLQKSDISLQGKLKKIFRAGLNEIKYDYVESKQHFYLQYHVAATDMKALRKKSSDTWSSGVPRVSRAWGQTQFRHSHPARSWQHKIKETLKSDALLAII